MKTTTEKAMAKKGQFGVVEWSRGCKVLKSCPHEIVKKTIAQNVRIGAGYDNLGTTIQGRADGTLPKENQGLNGLEWLKYPVLLKNPKTGKEFVRIETAKNTVFKTTYFADGREISKKEIESFLQASEKKSGEVPTVMNIGVDNITEIK